MAKCMTSPGKAAIATVKFALISEKVERDTAAFQRFDQTAKPATGSDCVRAAARKAS